MNIFAGYFNALDEWKRTGKRPLTNFDPKELPAYEAAIQGWPEFEIGSASTFGGTVTPCKNDLCLYHKGEKHNLSAFWKHALPIINAGKGNK